MGPTLCQGYRDATDVVTLQPPRDDVANLEDVVHEAEVETGKPIVRRKRSLTSLIIVCDASSLIWSLLRTIPQDLAFVLRLKWRSPTKTGTNSRA